MPEEEKKGITALGDLSLDTPPNTTADEKEEKETPTLPVVPPPATLNAEEFATKFGAVIAAAIKPVEPAAKGVDDLTPEEAKRILNLWEPDAEWQKKFDNLETRDAALKEMRDGIAKHTNTVTQYRVREATESLEKKFTPALEYMARREEEETRGRLNKTYPQLADPALEPLLKSVAETIAKTGKKFTEKELFAEIGSSVEAIIKVNNPDFKLTAGSTPAKDDTKPAGGIPVMTPGAGGGGGDHKDDKTPVKRGLAVFEPV